MKKYIYTGLIFAVLLGAVFVQQKQIKAVKADRDTCKKNTDVLLSDVERYRVSDSLQSVSVSEMSLTIGEYKKYRQEDMKLIAKLKIDRSRLQQVTAAQTQTVHEPQGIFKDSAIRKNRFSEAFQKANAAFDSIYTDTLKRIHINEKWFEINGCIDANSKFAGRFETRDSLIYVEHIVPKRFWFIRWGVKERKQEIVSRNPHTKITGAEFVTIRKSGQAGY